MVSRRALLLGALPFLPLSFKAPDIRVTVSPVHAFATRQTVTCRIHIPPDPRNRGVCLILESDQHSQQSCWMTSEDDPPTTQKQWRLLPQGSYRALAILERSDRSVVTSNVAAFTIEVPE